MQVEVSSALLMAHQQWGRAVHGWSHSWVAQWWDIDSSVLFCFFCVCVCELRGRSNYANIRALIVACRWGSHF